MVYLRIPVAVVENQGALLHNTHVVPAEKGGGGGKEKKREKNSQLHHQHCKQQRGHTVLALHAEQTYLVMIERLPVAVTNRSQKPHASSMVVTRKPAMHACSAQIGSISVM